MNDVQALLSCGGVWTREVLANALAVNDREIRRMVQQARKNGVPIVSMPTGGYKLAETEAEKKQLLHLYMGRAMDELETYNKLVKGMKLEGQMCMSFIEDGEQE